MVVRAPEPLRHANVALQQTVCGVDPKQLERSH
jgi:hypothetical protein